MGKPEPVIYLNCRCLQGPERRASSIGRHALSLLRSRLTTPAAEFRTIALYEHLHPKPDVEGLTDVATSTVNPIFRGTDNDLSIFIELSPTTHGIAWCSRFLGRSDVIKIGVVHDFLDHDWPSALPSSPRRLEYAARLAGLRSASYFFAVSNYAAVRLQTLLGIPTEAVAVTGPAMFESMFAAAESQKAVVDSHMGEGQGYFVCRAGDGERGNIAFAIRAVAGLNRQTGHAFRLVILEDCEEREIEPWRKEVAGLVSIEFLPAPAPMERARRYAGAIGAICPTYLEGVPESLIEAGICGCPVVASNCGAHAELVTDPSALFSARDLRSGVACLERLIRDETWRAHLVSQLAAKVSAFREENVGRIFWAGVERVAAAAQRSTRVAPRPQKRPSLALLTPFRPDPAPVSEFGNAFVEQLAVSSTVDLFTDTVRPLRLPERGVRDAGRVGITPYVSSKYDAVVSVFGKSHCGKAIATYFERYGGPCILYELDPADGSIPLECILELAKPLIVHSEEIRTDLQKRYAFEALLAPLPPSQSFLEHQLAPAGRTAARNILGIPLDGRAIAHFGPIGEQEIIRSCIEAVEFVRRQYPGIRLYFVQPPGTVAPALSVNTPEFVFPVPPYSSHGVYRNFLLAVDIALVLSSSRSGNASSALADCAAAGLDTICTAQMAVTTHAPDYVRHVSDATNPDQIRSEIIDILGSTARMREAVRQEYLDRNGFGAYCKLVMGALGFEI